jgi:hypothetical protein
LRRACSTWLDDAVEGIEWRICASRAARARERGAELRASSAVQLKL